MIFAKIENSICTNILVFDSKENAIRFDENLVELEEGYGIGDTYNGEWVKKLKTEEELKQERIEEIKIQLETLDGTVERQWEDYYIKWEITPVDRIAVVITQKEELRAELQNLTKVGE